MRRQCDRFTFTGRAAAAALVLTGLASCSGPDQETLEQLQAETEMTNYRLHRSSMEARLETDERLKSFSAALARAVTEPRFGEVLKTQIGRKFDGDHDALWSQVRNQRTGRGSLGAVLGDHLTRALGDVERIPFLNMAMPVNFEKWDGRSPVLVTYLPTAVDDEKVPTLEAFDAEGKVHLLDTRTPPSVPVLVVGINERMDPSTGRLYPEYAELGRQPADASGVTARSQAQVMTTGFPDFFLQWLYLFNDHEPWAKGSAEILVMVLVDSGKKVGPLRFTEKNDGNYYNLNTKIFKYAQDLTRFVAVRLDEDDGGTPIDVELGLSNTTKPDGGELKIDLKTKFRIHDSDDHIGVNELIDVRLGPNLPFQTTHPGTTNNMERVGDGAVTFWFPKVTEVVVQRGQMFPFHDVNHNRGRINDWDISGLPDNADFAYMLDIGTSIKVDITTCHPDTQLDTLIELFSANGPTGLVNDQDESCPFSFNSSSLKGVHLNPGVYWLVVDGWDGTEGQFHISISPSPCPPEAARFTPGGRWRGRQAFVSRGSRASPGCRHPSP